MFRSFKTRLTKVGETLVYPSKRAPALLALVSLLVSFLTIIPIGTANAAVPTLKWPAVAASPLYSSVVTSPSGDVTVGCSNDNPTQDLTTYSSTGSVVRQISRTTTIDGVANCIKEPIVDKNGTVYGVPWGPLTAGGTDYGPNLLAYSGNTLKWKYPVGCGSDRLGQWAVGADGNIYALTPGHLIGIAPDLKAGQTQPDKVLDVSIPSDCSAHVLPYKDGIMVHGQRNGPGRYYSYSGKYLGQATIGDIWAEKMGADGRLFVGSFVSGSYKSAKISMYDPRRGAVAWETIASTSGANVSDYALYPLPGGGTAAIITEQKMIGGIPASPTVYVKTLVVLNANGQKVRSVELRNAEPNGDTYGNTRVYPDVSGKLVVVRDMEIKTTVSYPATVAGVSIMTYDPATNTWPYQQVMSGNADKSVGSLYGYIQNYAGYSGPILDSGALFLVAKCAGNCVDYTSRLYPVAISGIGMDYPRGEILTANTPAQPAPRSYDALGDSFAAGEGNPPFVDTTACDRSTVAYPRVNGLDPYTSLQMDKFVACSGAQTTHVLNGWNDSTHSEPSQVSALSSGNPRVVTITIGGNDIFFSGFASACVVDTCNFTSAAYNTSLNAINNTLGGSLTTTYKKLLEVTKTAGTKVYVLGYPQVIANKTITDPGDVRCPYMYESVPVASGRYWEDARAARDIVTRLNAKITDTVNAVRLLDVDNQRLTFVSATEANSPFNTHEVCGSDESYFNNVDQAGNNTAYVFHPNEKGQAAYARLVRQAIGE